MMDEGYDANLQAEIERQRQESEDQRRRREAAAAQQGQQGGLAPMLNGLAGPMQMMGGGGAQGAAAGGIPSAGGGAAAAGGAAEGAGGLGAGAAGGAGGAGAAGLSAGPFALAAAVLMHHQWAKNKGLHSNSDALLGRAFYKDADYYQEKGNEKLDGLGDDIKMSSLGSSPADVFKADTWKQAAQLAAKGGLVGKLVKKIF